MQEGKKIYLIGIGLGTSEGLTEKAEKCLQEGDIFVGAKRMLEILPENESRKLYSYYPQEIGAALRENTQWRRACVLLSGDVGFYSGAKKMLQELSDFEVELVPGISSLAAFCARLQIPWDDISFGSLHGRRQNLIARIRHNPYTFALLGGPEDLLALCEKICYYRMDDVTLHVGERLGYPQERVIHGSVSEIMGMSFDKLLVVVAENPSPQQALFPEIPDEAFIRGEMEKVPMTKCEVRSASIQKLGLTKKSVLYDVGAGTGSVSIQAGCCYPDCDIYAIEERPAALRLLEQNKRKFIVDNMTVVAGHAPEAMEGLPAPTHVFVGGSGGCLRSILQSVYQKNPHVVVVMNFISLENLSEMLCLTREWHLQGVQMVQLSVSRTKEIGSSHLLMGQNPVTIVTVPMQESMGIV